MNVTVTQYMTQTQAIHFEGPDAWVDVTGLLADRGGILAAGIGEVAGFPDIDVTLVGTITKDSLVADYTMDKSGKLPNGEPIVFKIFGTEYPDGPPSVYTDTLVQTDVYSNSVRKFVDGLNEAFQTQNVDHLFDDLHPAVIDLYGSDGCFNYLSGVIVNPISLEIVNLRGPETWDWERDGRNIPVTNVFTIDANLSFSGQTQPQEFHVALYNEKLAWFFDCGDPKT